MHLARPDPNPPAKTTVLATSDGPCEITSQRLARRFPTFRRSLPIERHSCFKSGLLVGGRGRYGLKTTVYGWSRPSRLVRLLARLSGHVEYAKINPLSMERLPPPLLSIFAMSIALQKTALLSAYIRGGKSIEGLNNRRRAKERYCNCR